MATENLVIVVNERGARVVKGKLEDIGKGAKRAEGGVTLLRRALGVLAGAAVIRSLVRTADAFTNIQNRLRLVTESTSQLNAVQNELLAISNRTRSAFETNADLFNRLALSTRELGLTQRDVLELTESLNQAVIISGASSAEASAGLIQLSQGLASGALRGDELRSVLEQLPAVADVIAKQLGVTRGELRTLGQEGKITAEVVTEAFKNAREELNDRFGRTVPTIGQAFTTLRNNLVDFVGRVAEAIGFTGGLARIITALGGRVGSLTDRFVEGALAIREFTEVATVSLVTFADRTAARFNKLEATIAGVFGQIIGNDELVESAIAVSQAQDARIDDSLRRLDEEFEAIARNAKARRDALVVDEGSLDDLLPGGSGQVAEINELDDATKKLIQSQEDLLAALLLEEAAMGEALSTGEDFGEILARMETDAIGVATGMQGLAFDINATRAELVRLRQEQENTDFIQGLTEEVAAMQVAIATGRELNDVLEDMTLARQFEGDPEGLKRALDLTEARRQLEGQLDDAQDDVSDFLRRARENAQDVLGDALSNAFSGGLEELPERFARVLQELASQFLASAIFQELSKIGQGSSSGFLQSIGGFFGGDFNQGGSFQVPNVGGGGPDSVPTLLNLTPRETVTITPAGQQPSVAPQAPPQVNLNPTIVNTIDPSDITGAFQDGSGDGVLLNRISVKQSAFRRALGINR